MRCGVRHSPCGATFKKRARDWGLKGDKGNASQVVPLVPLEKITKQRITKKYANKAESKATWNLKEMQR